MTKEAKRLFQELNLAIKEGEKSINDNKITPSQKGYHRIIKWQLRYKVAKDALAEIIPSYEPKPFPTESD